MSLHADFGPTATVAYATFDWLTDPAMSLGERAKRTSQPQRVCMRPRYVLVPCIRLQHAGHVCSRVVLFILLLANLTLIHTLRIRPRVRAST